MDPGLFGKGSGDIKNSGGEKESTGPEEWAHVFGMGDSYMAFSSCTPKFFFLHPHNFLNPEIGLNILFEKGHHDYRK